MYSNMICGVWWSISFCVDQNVCFLGTSIPWCSILPASSMSHCGHDEESIKCFRRKGISWVWNIIYYTIVFCFVYFFFAIRASSGLYTLRAVQHRKTETSLSCKSGVGNKILTALTILTSDSQNPLARCNFHSHGNSKKFSIMIHKPIMFQKVKLCLMPLLYIEACCLLRRSLLLVVTSN